MITSPANVARGEQRLLLMAGKNRKGRTKGGTLGPDFVGLPGYMLKSAAWASLSPNGRAALIEVIRPYNGRNNGSLAMSGRRLEKLLPISRATATRALYELVEKGFLEVVTPSSFGCKMKRATEYRLTFHRCDVTGDLPTKAFTRWSAKFKTRPHQIARADTL